MSAPKLIDDFTARVMAKNPLHVNFLKGSLKLMREDTRAELVRYLEYGTSIGLTLDYLAESYNTIVVDMQVEQIYFRQNKKYRSSRFAEVADKVYFDESYMRKYMYGLAITSFLWPNHVILHDFFVRTFPHNLDGNYLEIGPGHGYYFMQAARLSSFDHLFGVDISAASVALTRDILHHFGLDREKSVEIIEADFLALPSSQRLYSCIVMGEVLEHLEDPGLFLTTLAQLSGPHTHIFVTTCMNAPAIDHIYLFRTGREIEELIATNGLRVVESCYAPYVGKTLAECEEQGLPVNVGYVLRKA